MKSNRSPYLKNILIYLLIIILTLELSPFLLGSFILENGYSRKEIRNEIKIRANQPSDSSNAAETNPEGYLSQHMIHPYLGFVHEPGGTYNNFGFLYSEPVPKKTEDTLNVLITGGSVAKQLVQVSEETLIRELNQIPAFRDKKIKLIVLALGGFKQPQQLLALNYYSGQGAFFDLVINLDGFNEVVLPYADNLPFGIHPSYPRHWNIYSRKMLDKQSTILLGQQAFMKKKQQKRARRILAGPFKISNFVLFLWKITDRETDFAIHQLETDLRNHLASGESSPQTTGPFHEVSDTLGFLKQQVDSWAACSKLMDALCSSRGFLYFHFLQPNQYVEGSKTLTEEEQLLAFQEGDFPYKTAVNLAYPILIRKGQELVREGLNYTDLTPLFREIKHTVYSDKCCHFNKTGYDAIALEITKVLRRSQPSGDSAAVR